MAPRERVARTLSPLIFSDSTVQICSSCRHVLYRRYPPHSDAASSSSRPSPGTRHYHASSFLSSASSTAPAAAQTSRNLPEQQPQEPHLITTAEAQTLPDPTSLVRPSYAIQAGVVLSRPPFLTRTLHPFEKAFFLYQRRLNERLALPFTRYFYYKKGTPGDREWKRKIKQRLTPARDIGVYTGYGDKAWNDELLVGDQTSEPEIQRQKLIQDVLDAGSDDPDADAVAAAAASSQASGESETAKEGEKGTSSGKEKSAKELEAERIEAEHAEAQRRKSDIELPESRISEADRIGDVKDLNRLGERTLYLLVKGRDGQWTFPSSELQGKELLHQAAERIVVQAGGPNMNTWILGKVPIGHHAATYETPLSLPTSIAEQSEKHSSTPAASAASAASRKPSPSNSKTPLEPESDQEAKEQPMVSLGKKTFFLKGRIMSGQANIAQNQLGLEDFKWLTKDEVKDHVTKGYWSQVENMLSQR